MAELKISEELVLRYPPTDTTWVCKGNVIWRESGTCGTINVGRSDRCICCDLTKPRKPKLLWPEYLEACKKAGIEPGTSWPLPVEDGESKSARKPTKRKGA